MAEIKKGKSQKHHIVPRSYLDQWRTKSTQLEIFLHKKGQIVQKGPNWSGFKKKDYNIFDSDDDYYLPERVTEDVDGQGIVVLRNIDSNRGLTGYERSVLAHYTALQYVRTPRFREETNAFMDANIKEWFLEDQKSKTDKEILQFKIEIESESYTDPKDIEAIKKIKAMSNIEFIKLHREEAEKPSYSFILNRFGHSKFILKIPEKARGIYEFQWMLLQAPDNTSFVTSDNPCFAVPKEESDLGVGLFSPNGYVIFPLRPDLCLMIDPQQRGRYEIPIKLNRKHVKEVNQMILKNSYDVVVAKDKTHLKSLTKDYQHVWSRNVEKKKIGDYTLFALK